MKSSQSMSYVEASVLRDVDMSNKAKPISKPLHKEQNYCEPSNMAGLKRRTC